MIEIVFKDGIFQEVNNLFDPPYTDSEWKVLSIIYNQIQELKKFYFKESKTIVPESEVEDGYV